MMNMHINTDMIDEMARGIMSCNENMEDHLHDLTQAINRLDANWNGKASQEAAAWFNMIKTKNEPQRYNVIDGLARYLKSTVSPQAKETEEENTNLAERFK